MEYEKGYREFQGRSKPLRKANICTIPSPCDFLGVLVDSLVSGELIPGFTSQPNNPFALSDCTIYVPNRRAARGLANAFMDRIGDGAVLLPSIRTVGDVDDDEFGLGEVGREALELAPPIEGMERRLVLARFVERWLDRISLETRKLYESEEIHIPASQADAVRLSGDLARLMDQVALEEIDWYAIRDIVPEEHAKWWELTGTFLQIVMSAWPDFLKEQGRTDPALHRAKLLELRAKALAIEPPRGPVIIAGSTGSVPSTRRLLRQVASMEKGAIVLPGLDLSRSESEWRAILHRRDVAKPLNESHPQYGLAVLLNFLQAQPEHVRELGDCNPTVTTRMKLVAEAMTPSDMTPNWHEKIRDFSEQERANAFRNVSLVQAKNERAEASAIAIALRETLNEPGKTAALVTPDRKLARRVSNELTRYGILVDDTAGAPLASTAAAAFVRQLVSLVFDNGGSIALATLIRNKLCTCGLETGNAQAMANAFEHLTIRNIVKPPAPGEFRVWLLRRLEQLASARRTHKPAVWRRMDEDDRETLLAFASVLDGALLPLRELHESDELLPLSQFATALEYACEQLTRCPDGSSALLETSGTNALQSFLEELVGNAGRQYPIQPGGFSSIFEALLEGHTARDKRRVHPRLYIYGPLEVRLIHQDRVVLGGLNEGTWPSTQRNDAFLNRTMRDTLGMDSPERRTGLSAHDFQQLMGRAEVILTRSSRMERAPSVASRWLQRMQALLGEDCWTEICSRGERYLEFARLLDQPEETVGLCAPPAPIPAVDDRPSELTVSDVEDWIRDPYKLYAKRILQLSPLAPLTREADSALRGTVYHAIMDEFIKRDLHRVPDDERSRALKELSREIIDRENLDPDVARKWQLRFETIAESYSRWEGENRPNAVYTEVSGEAYYGETNFTLSARADRLDVTGENTVRILDYKTSKNPARHEARTVSPQLILEASIAARGGFQNLPDNLQVEDFLFLRMLNEGKFQHESVCKGKEEKAPEILIKETEEQLESLIAAFEKPEQPYIAHRAPKYASAYDHLARVAEWSYAEDDAEGSAHE